jgi:hypothetical protein
LIIGTLQGARVFGEDNYDTLITKAAVHGAKLLKKPHQATAVMLASHMWWQADAVVGEAAGETEGEDAEERKVSACVLLLCWVRGLMVGGGVAETGWETRAGVFAKELEDCEFVL